MAEGDAATEGTEAIRNLQAFAGLTFELRPRAIGP
jgi:hypothetical protein